MKVSVEDTTGGTYEATTSCITDDCEEPTEIPRSGSARSKRRRRTIVAGSTVLAISAFLAGCAPLADWETGTEKASGGPSIKEENPGCKWSANIQAEATADGYRVKAPVVNYHPITIGRALIRKARAR